MCFDFRNNRYSEKKEKGKKRLNDSHKRLFEGERIQEGPRRMVMVWLEEKERCYFRRLKLIE